MQSSAETSAGLQQVRIQPRACWVASSPTLPARSIQLVPSSSMGRCSCICQGEKAQKILYFESNDDCKSGSCLQGAGFLMLRRAVPRVGWCQAHRFPADGSSPFLLPLLLFPGRFSAASSRSRPGVPRSRCCSCGEEWHCVLRSWLPTSMSCWVFNVWAWLFTQFPAPPD